MVDESQLRHQPSSGEIALLSSVIASNHKITLSKLDSLSRRIEALDAKQDAHDVRLHAHIEIENKKIEEIREIVATAASALEDKVLSGFPENDPKKHCEYHVEIIEDADRGKKRRDEVITFAVKQVVWGGVSLVAFALWLYTKAQIKL
jgi:hypothetical protein